jgi:hypothetical protein
MLPLCAMIARNRVGNPIAATGTEFVRIINHACALPRRLSVLIALIVAQIALRTKHISRKMPGKSDFV